MSHNDKSLTSVLSTAGSSRVTRVSRSKYTSQCSTVSTNVDVVPKTFEKLLPYVVKKFGLDFDVYVHKRSVKDGIGAFPKNIPSYPASTDTYTDLIKIRKVRLVEPVSSTICNIFQMAAIYDNRDSFVEISIQNSSDIPCQLFKIILTIAPSFPTLTKISIRNCPVTNRILLELNRLQSINKLTQITLDGSYLYGRNIEILLNQESYLGNLSLNRCNIYDDGCREISMKLKYPNDAERNLVFLSLSGNKITDSGVKYLAEMLRTNRCLRYLNLASNQITDDGVQHLLAILNEFPLNDEEIIIKRNVLVNQFSKLKPLLQSPSAKNKLSNISSQNKKVKRQSSKIRSKTKFQIADSDGKVHLNVQQILEQYRNPFSEKFIFRRDCSLYCRGNNILCYLNLSYNELTHRSVKNIADFLQHKLNTDSADADMIKFRIEGNALLRKCKEFARIDQYYESKLKAYHTHRVSVSKGSVRSRRSSSIK